MNEYSVLNLSLSPNNGEGNTWHSVQRNSYIYMTFIINYTHFLYNKVLLKIAEVFDWEKAVVA